MIDNKNNLERSRILMKQGFLESLKKHTLCAQTHTHTFTVLDLTQYKLKRNPLKHKRSHRNLKKNS